MILLIIVLPDIPHRLLHKEFPVRLESILHYSNSQHNISLLFLHIPHLYNTFHNHLSIHKCQLGFVWNIWVHRIHHYSHYFSCTILVDLELLFLGNKSTGNTVDLHLDMQQQMNMGCKVCTELCH